MSRPAIVELESPTLPGPTQSGPALPGPVKQRPRGRPAADADHAVPEERVLDAAFHAFAQNGYEGTTLRALAKQLGVSHNLLNVRFGSKADLWRRAVDAVVARIAPPVFAALDVAGLSDEERFRELIYRFCLWAARNPEFVSLTHIEGRRATWRLDHLVTGYILPFKERLDALWLSVAAAHGVPAAPTTMIMALLVQGVGSYFASVPLRARIEGGPGETAGQIERQSRMFGDLILSGLIPQPRSRQGACQGA